MEFLYRKSYRGRIQAVILDWAGTTIDYGCLAPVAALMRTFERHGISISVEQARGPMGLGKKDHIRALTRLESIARQWQAIYGQPCAEPDVEKMHHYFETQLIVCLGENSDVIPGAIETVSKFRARGLKIGSTTGYAREIMVQIIPEVKRRGYMPDSVVCPDEVCSGRPSPWMCFQTMQHLQVFPTEAVVKIGDTIPDIEEGLNAGMWTIGVAKTGNEMGLSEKEIAALDPALFEARRRAAYWRLAQVGAHYVVDSIAECDTVLDDINARLEVGDRP